MHFNQWLDTEGERGRASSLAAHFKVTPAAISQWKANGVPLAQMQAVRDFTGGAVSVEEMVAHATEAKAA